MIVYKKGLKCLYTAGFISILSAEYFMKLFIQIFEEKGAKHL